MLKDEPPSFRIDPILGTFDLYICIEEDSEKNMLIVSNLSL